MSHLSQLFSIFALVLGDPASHGIDDGASLSLTVVCMRVVK